MFIINLNTKNFDLLILRSITIFYLIHEFNKNNLDFIFQLISIFHDFNFTNHLLKSNNK
jgi:hypothetical protein